MWGHVRPFNEHENLHFDNGKDIHTSSENHEESGYNFNLELLMILYWVRVSYKVGKTKNNEWTLLVHWTTGSFSLVWTQNAWLQKWRPKKDAMKGGMQWLTW